MAVDNQASCRSLKGGSSTLDFDPVVHSGADFSPIAMFKLSEKERVNARGRLRNTCARRMRSSPYVADVGVAARVG